MSRYYWAEMKIIRDVLLFVLLYSTFSFCRGGSINLEQRSVSKYIVESYYNSGDYVLAKVVKPLPKTRRSYLDANSDTPISGTVFVVVAEVTIGGQQFKVQVDTGSALLAVPQKGCSGCGSNDPDPFLDPDSAAALTCSDARCTASECNSQETTTCGFSVEYVDDSSISGVLNVASVTMAGLTATDVVFGGTTVSSSGFEAPTADGIVVFAYNNEAITCSPNCVTPLFDYLVEENNIPNVFGIFLDYQDGGSLSLGLIDSSLHSGPIQYTPVIDQSFYIVNLLQIQVGGYTVSDSSTTFGQVIVDSGTSLIVLPKKVFDAIQSYLQSEYSSLPGVTGDNNLWSGYCITDSAALSQFPTLQFVLSPNVTVSVPPANYLPLSPTTEGSTAYCLGLETGSAGQVILGDVFLRGLYTVFDRDNNQVGFATTSASTGSASTIAASFLLVSCSLFIAVL